MKSMKPNFRDPEQGKPLYKILDKDVLGKHSKKHQQPQSAKSVKSAKSAKSKSENTQGSKSPKEEKVGDTSSIINNYFDNDYSQSKIDINKTIELSFA